MEVEPDDSDQQMPPPHLVLPYRPERVYAAGKHFDATVRRIRAGEFAVAEPPEPRICRECDLRTLCRAKGVIGGRSGLMASDYGVLAGHDGG